MKIFRLLTAILLLCTTACEVCFAATSSTTPIPSNEIWYTSTDGKKIKPDYGDGFKHIAKSHKFKDGKGVIVLKDGVTELKNFSHYYSLKTLIIGDCITSIGFNAFNDCKQLESIELPDGITEIDSWAFDGCKSLTTINIPDSIKVIGHNAFEDCSSLTTIIIPNGITVIDVELFMGCSSLTSVVIPDGVTSIGENAFKGCSSLESIVIPDGVATIGENAFNGCSSLESVVIPDSVTTIGECAFNGCSSLESITIPDGVTTIGKNAFSHCSSLTSVDIPDSVTTIGEYAFEGCHAIKSVTIGKGVNTIGQYAFAGLGGCLTINSDLIDTIFTASESAFSSSYFDTIIIGDNITDINSYFFSGYESLKSVTIGKGVKAIHEAAFKGCSNLTSVTIPDNVAEIGNSAFEGCQALTTVKILGKNTQVGSWAFYNCDNLKELYINNPTPGKWLSNINAYKAFNIKLYVPYKAHYATHKYISDNRLTYLKGNIYGYDFEKDAVVEIQPYNEIWYEGDNYCETIFGVYLPHKERFGANCINATWDAVTRKGVLVFDGDVTKVGPGAFDEQVIGPILISSVSLPNSITTLESEAFHWAGMDSLTIPDNVTSIAINAFDDNGIGEFKGKFATEDGAMLIVDNVVIAVAYDDHFTDIVIPEGVTSISQSAFHNNTKITSITIPESVTGIEIASFLGCTNIKEFKGKYASTDGLCLVVDGVLKAFATGSQVSTYTIPDGVTTIDTSAFNGSQNLVKVVIPDSVITIESSAFWGCEKLTTVQMGKNVKVIGDYAFHLCCKLAYITIPQSVTSIGEYAFCGTKLNTVKWRNGTIKVDHNSPWMYTCLD